MNCSVAHCCGVGVEWRPGQLRARQWGRGTRAAVTQRARVKCVVIDKPSDARLRNQASITEQDVRKRLQGSRIVWKLGWGMENSVSKCAV